MEKKPKLRELIDKARNGDEDALVKVIHRFVPLVRKYSRRLGYAEACSDLVIWIVRAIRRYKPNTTWGKEELERYLFDRGYEKNK